jgi:ABC-type cobalamin/Fe3+-siderophores transport system ATPase subunit
MRMRTDYSTSSLVIGNILFRDSGTAYNAQTQRHRLRLYGREYYTRRLTGVDKGEIVTITEPNDPGKSTLMKTVFGLVELRSGRIQFDGSDISRFSLLIVEQNAKKSLAVSHRG